MVVLVMTRHMYRWNAWSRGKLLVRDKVAPLVVPQSTGRPALRSSGCKAKLSWAKNGKEQNQQKKEHWLLPKEMSCSSSSCRCHAHLAFFVFYVIISFFVIFVHSGLYKFWTLFVLFCNFWTCNGH